MKCLLISRDERHAFLLEQLESEGNEVRLLAKNDTGAWKGLVERTKNLEEARKWEPDIVVIDSPGFGPLAKTLQDDGYKVFGGSKLQDKLAENFQFGMSILEAAGVPTSDYTKFDSISDAAEYVQGKRRPWLFRYPDGRFHCCSTDVDLQLYMEGINAAGLFPDTFSIQKGFPEFINAGIMLRPQFYLVGFFNSEGLMNPVLQMDMAYNLLPDGQGVPTVEGVNLRPVELNADDVDKTLRKLEKTLTAMRYCGPVFLGCMTDWEDGERHVCAVDVQMSPPDGFWAAAVRGLTMPLQNFLDRVCNPRRPNTPYEFYKGFVCSRKLTLPPYPYTEAPWTSPAGRYQLAKAGIPPTRFRREPWGVYWNDVFQAEGEPGFLQASGPLLGYVVGRGDCCQDAAREAQKIAGSCAIPYAQMKVDDGLAEFNLTF